MGGKFTPIELQLGAGVDTKVDSKLVKPPSLITAENVVFTGAPGIKKRYGYSDETAPANGVKALTLLGDGLLALTPYGEVSVYSGDVWSTRDYTVAYTATEQTQFSEVVDQENASSATMNGVRVVAWESGTSVYYAAVNDATGVYLLPPTVMANTSTAPQVVCAAFADLEVWIFYVDTSLDYLSYKVIEVGTPGAVTGVSGGNLSTAMNTSGVFSVSERRGDDGFVVAWLDSSNNIKFAPYGPSPASFGTTRTVVSAPGTQQVSVSGGTNYAWVGWSTADGRACTRIDIATGTVLSTINLSEDAGITAVHTTATGDTCFAFSSRFQHATPIMHSYRISGSGAKTNGHTEFQVEIVGQPFSPASGTSGGRSCILPVMAPNLPSQGKVLFKYFSDGGENPHRYVGHALDGVMLGTKDVKFLPPATSKDKASTSYEICFPFGRKVRVDKDLADLGSTDDFLVGRGIKRVTLDFDSTEMFSSAQAGGTVYLNSGMLTAFDGVELLEQGFLQYPEVADSALTPSNGAGSMTVAAEYSYRVYFEHTNAQGETKRSTTARVATVTMGAADDTVTLVVNNPITNQSTASQGDISIVTYRTEANSDIVGGAPLYRVGSTTPSTSGTTSIVDTMSDVNLINNELDYLNTGELDNAQPPPAGLIATGGGRVWLSGLEDPGAVIYSKLREAGGALEFNESLKIVVPEEGGRVTALAPLGNGLMVFFKKDRIFVMGGLGPNNLGAGAFSAVESLTTDVGCATPRSIVNVPDGVMFKSDKGIYKLDRNLATTYVGAPVEGYNSQTVTAATLMNDVNEVRFLTDSGATLVYNYSIDAWSTFTITGTDAVVWNENYTYLRTSTSVRSEDSTTHKDAGTYVVAKVRTAWIRPAEMAGLWRCRRFLVTADATDKHGLYIRGYYNYSESDYDTSAVQTFSTAGEFVQRRYNLARQKLQAVSFEIYDEDASSTTGAGYELHSLAVEIQQKDGPAKLASSKTTSGS